MAKMNSEIVTVMPLNTAIIIPCKLPANNHGSKAVKNTSNQMWFFMRNLYGTVRISVNSRPRPAIVLRIRISMIFVRVPSSELPSEVDDDCE